MKNLNEKWYYEEKMIKTLSSKFSAVQKSEIIKHLRLYSEIREAIQRELCALQAYKHGLTGGQLYDVRNAFIPSNEFHNLRREQARIRQLYKQEFSILREFEARGKFIQHICSQVDIHKIDSNEVYVVRIFETGETHVYKRDKPSIFYQSTFDGNAQNLSKIKRSLCHIHNMEASSPIISKLKIKEI